MLLFIIFPGVFITAYIVFKLFKKKSYSKHDKNIAKAKKILQKLRCFKGDFKSKSQFTYLQKINPYVFEELLLTCFEERGFCIERSKSYSGDGGLDGKVWIDDVLIYLQAKCYGKGKHIKAKHVAEFRQLIISNNVKGLFIHTGKTGLKAYNNAYNESIDIISGNKLLKLIMGEPINVFTTNK